MLGNELPDAAPAERVDTGAVFFEAEALEDLRVLTEIGIDGGFPSQIVFAVISADVVFPISPDLAALQDSLVIGCRHVACRPQAKQFIRHQEKRIIALEASP